MKRDDYAIVKASCCLPIACKPYWVDGVPYFDGGVADRCLTGAPLRTAAANWWYC